MRLATLDDYGQDEEQPKKPGVFRRFLSALNRHKWAIMLGVVLTAGIIAACVVFWPFIVGFAPVVTAAAAISSVTMNLGFAVSATVFAATSISIVGAAFVSVASFVFDKVLVKIKNQISNSKSSKNKGSLDDPLIDNDLLNDENDRLEGRTTLDISQSAGIDLAAPAASTHPVATAEEILLAKPQAKRMIRRFNEMEDQALAALATPEKKNKF